MLKRKIDSYLLKWKNERKTALLVDGARQIGKTFSIRNFIANNFENVIEINFANEPDKIKSFLRLKNSDDLLLRISMFFGDKMVPGKTVVFLDEIQLLYSSAQKEDGDSSIDLITAMKPLTESGDYRFILSGSLLGVNVKDVLLYPLGYMDEYKMYPLDFEEFLWAKGVGTNAIEAIYEHFKNREAVPDDIHDVFMNYFREYVLIGGMPEAVSTYVNKKNIYLVSEINSQILSRYASDITTYIKDDLMKLRVREIYKAIPSELNAKNKRFIATHVLERRFLRDCSLLDEYLWLTASGIAIPVYNVDEPIVPLTLSSDRKTLKLFMSDTGLLSYALAGTDIREKLLLGDKEINYGAPYENAVAMELCAHGYDGSIFYYNSKKHGEVDFLIESGGDVLPIEIKSGKPEYMYIYNATALRNLVAMYKYPVSFIFGETNIVDKDNIVQLPIYMIMFIKK